MKIVDQTPFYKENGELSLLDRGKAIMQFGPGWFKQIEAQKSVISILKKFLDKNYTLLCNVIPPGLDARIPLILVGPTGVYVMTVTAKIGMFRARGDQWGIVSGSAIRPENPNLLTLTEKMARAIQVYLQRQGYADMSSVEAILLCSDPATMVDSMRPNIRVIMRDSLERFAASISQARIVFSAESSFDVVNRLVNPPPPSKPTETPPPETPAAPSAQPGAPSVPAFAVAGSAAVPASAAFPQATTSAPRPRSRFGLSRKQVIILVGMVVIWIVIILVIGFVIAINMNPPLIMVK
jgi:hypothetical protein